MQKTNLLAVLVFFSILNSQLQAETIRISTDASRWYPYTYVHEGNARGIHIDMVTTALKNLGHEVIFTPLPWKRCLKMVATGRSNAVVSASFKPERAKYMHYPSDAASVKKSRWRITQVGYVVVNHKDSNYHFNGDILTLPHPVRAPLGYSIVDDLQKKGVSVLTAPDFFKNMESLIRTQKGCVITPLMNAKLLQQDPRYFKQFKVNATEVASKSYFMAFSKKNAKISQTEIVKIWNELKRLRDDQSYMLQLTKRYQTNE